MTFDQLRRLLDEKIQIWGFTNAGVQPNLSDLVNEAYNYLCWQTELVHGPAQTFNSVVDQAEYQLPGTVKWKSVLDCIFDTIPIFTVNEHSLRRRQPGYLLSVSNTPRHYWLPRPNTIRLFPPPNTVKAVTVYGIMEVSPLVADTDEPIVPYAYQQAIALYAAYLHINKYAKGEARQRLGELLQEYQALEDGLKEEQAERVGMDAYLMRNAPAAERVFS